MNNVYFLILFANRTSCVCNTREKYIEKRVPANSAVRIKLIAMLLLSILDVGKHKKKHPIHLCKEKIGKNTLLQRLF